MIEHYLLKFSNFKDAWQILNFIYYIYTIEGIFIFEIPVHDLK